MLEIVLTSSESDQYSSAPKEISKFPLMYMTGYFCRSVYKNEIMGRIDFSNQFRKNENMSQTYWL